MPPVPKPDTNELVEAIRAALGSHKPPIEADGWFKLGRLKELTGLTDSQLQKKIHAQGADWEKQMYGRYVYYRHKNGR